MRLYLAGIEGKTEMFDEAKPPYILFSFASAQGGSKKSEKIMTSVRKPYCKDYLLDSGAFTFFTKGHSKTMAEWDRYVDSYIDFINAWDVHHFFELDIDRIVGLEKVEEFRRRIESKTGKQSIPVWHSNRGWQYFVNMCKEYSYVSIGGIAKNPNGKAIEKIFPWFIREAHRTGTQIHGLGYTDTKKLKQYPFDLVDSTSWSSGGRYGVTFELKGNSMCGKKNIYPDKKIDGQLVNLHNLKVWSQYAKSLDH